MTKYVQAILTVLSLVNPVICAAIFSKISHGKSTAARVADATKAATAVVVAMTVTWVIMILAGRTSSQQQPGLIHDVTTRFMGLIVLAMGVQFALTGLKEFLHPS